MNATLSEIIWSVLFFYLYAPWKKMGWQIKKQLKIHCLIWVISPFPLKLKFFLSTYNFILKVWGLIIDELLIFAFAFPRNVPNAQTSFFTYFAGWHFKYFLSLIEVWIIREGVERKRGIFLNHFIKGKRPSIESQPQHWCCSNWSQVAKCHSISPI